MVDVLIYKVREAAHQFVRPAGILRQCSDAASVHLHVLDVALDVELGGQVQGMKVQGGEFGAVGGKAVDDVEAGVDGLSGFQDQTVVLLK